MNEQYRFDFRAMASPCEIVLADADSHLARLAAAQAIAEVHRIEAKYSRFKSDSVIGQINQRAATERVAIDEETVALFAYAGHLNQLSDGLFDITTGSLQSVWDFQNAVIPDPDRLREALRQVGWRHVVLERGTVRFTLSGVRVDLGGFGKEYAADRAAAVLRGCGQKSGYVNLGGDLVVIGPKPGGAPWLMGIRHPRRSGELIASIPVIEGALATSGDYERYFVIEGRHYCHILSPLTGMPARGWQSISVLAPLATTAGATSTVAMLKQDGALNFLRDSGQSWLAIDEHGNTFSHAA